MNERIGMLLSDSLSKLIMYQQENNPQQSPWLQSLRNLTSFVCQSKGLLSMLSVKLFKKIGMGRYPIDGYLEAWEKFYKLLNQRIESFSSNGKLEAVVSTAFYWVIPEWAISYIAIQQFITRYNDGFQGEKITQTVFQEVCQELGLKQTWNLSESNTDQLLQVPVYYLQQLLVKSLELTSCLEERLHQSKSQMGNNNEETYMSMLTLMEVQVKMLQSCLGQLDSIIRMSKQQISSQRDNAVIRFDLITQQYDLIDTTHRRKILKYINRLKLIRHWKSLEKKRKQRLQERKKNIFLLIKGQENYLAGLNEYITKIKEPIEKLKILSINENRKLFSSIVQIKVFHENIFSILQEKYDHYNDEQCYAPVIDNIIPFFKIYTDYILNAESAQKFLKDLIKTNKAIAEICKEYTNTTKKLAENELLQPTFRIARYQALFQQILKKTSSSHKDYKHFIEVQIKFKSVLTQVNNEVDKIIRRMKLNELDNEFGKPQFPIFAENRQYLNEYTLTLIKEPYPQQVNLIICNDLLLIIDDATKKLQKSIPINQEFFARRQEDNKIYRNMITIHSDGFMTFTVGIDDIYANKANQIYQILKGITKQSGQLVCITVLGTEEIGSTSFTKYTEYIVEVKYLDIKKLLHVRFSLMHEMITQMQRYYNDSLKINDSQSLRKSWFNSHKSKTIEARKLIIGQIFQKLFNHELIKKNPAHFLRYLNLPENFYDIARSSYEKRISLPQTITISRLKRSYLTKKQERQAFTILCGTEIKLGRDLFHDNQNDQQLKKLKDSSRRIAIKVITLDQEEPAVLKITEYDTVQDVCNRISKLRGLRSNRDFRLFHEIGKKQLRVLEHEQIIRKIFQFPDQQEQQENMMVGFYQKMKKTIKKMVFPENYPILIFKKYYYLPYDIQSAEMRKDLVRLKLMVYQVFTEIKDMKYQLSFDEYLLFLAMLLYITADGRIDDIRQIDPDVVHRVIPDTIFKLKNYSEEEWLDKCSRHVTRLHEEILKVIEYNKQQIRQGRIKADTVSKQSAYFGRRHLCSQIVMNKIKTNPIFGSNLFYVQPYNTCYKKLEQKKLKVAYNMWLAVNFQSIKLLSPSSKEAILELKYEDIGKTEVFCEAIVFKTSDAIEQEYRLNTYQSFEISQLVKYNQALNDILLNLRQDAELNTRVKQYRDQLIQYRSTFDNNGGEEIISMIR